MKIKENVRTTENNFSNMGNFTKYSNCVFTMMPYCHIHRAQTEIMVASSFYLVFVLPIFIAYKTIGKIKYSLTLNRIIFRTVYNFLLKVEQDKNQL